jgi:uncharacterized Zn-binding protein involved in type VI secretion
MRFSMQASMFVVIPVVLCCGLGAAAAQSVGGVTEGSPNVMIGGKPAARVGDGGASGAAVEGSPNVFINGRPAAIAGGKTNCGGVVIGGSSNVFINGKPAAQAGNPTGDCKGR